jgi:transposase
MENIIKLTYPERSALESILARSRHVKQLQRAQALLLLEEGENAEAVAELLRVSRQTIYNWIARFRTRFQRPVAERLFDAPRSGHPALAGGLIDELLDEVIETDPRQWGYRSTIWTAELLQDYLSDYYQITAGRRSVRYALERLDIIWKRPRHTLALAAENWRPAKGGSNTASGRGRGRSS